MHPRSDHPGIPGVVEHLFRHEAGKMVATLTRIFGTDHLGLAEDVVQEALARALRTWPFHGIPENPSAWLLRTARNLALDTVRRQKVFRDKEGEIGRLTEALNPFSSPLQDAEIADDRLRMIFVCCHPLVSEEAQTALVLRTLCGFSVGEIARAFLTSEAAIAKRLTRAKQQIRDARLPFVIPEGRELERRLDGVLRSLYLLFNEGYKATGGEALVREEVCTEAIRLAALLARHPVGNQPRTHALLALLFLNAARNPARLDLDGNLCLLQEQDRSQWDGARLGQGLHHFALSASGEALSVYHLQAGIAACHSLAPDYAATDWRHILALYDALSEQDRSPVVALNRAVAVAHLRGPQAGLDAVEAIGDLAKLDGYYLLHAVRGEFAARLNHPENAARHFQRAIALAENKAERVFLARKLALCGDGRA